MGREVRGRQWSDFGIVPIGCTCGGWFGMRPATRARGLHDVHRSSSPSQHRSISLPNHLNSPEEKHFNVLSVDKQDQLEADTHQQRAPSPTRLTFQTLIKSPSPTAPVAGIAARTFSADYDASILKPSPEEDMKLWSKWCAE